MARPCYCCQVDRCEECVDVNCFCFRCCADDKDQLPVPYPQ